MPWVLSWALVRKDRRRYSARRVRAGSRREDMRVWDGIPRNLVVGRHAVMWVRGGRSYGG